MNTTLNFDGEQLPIQHFSENAYLNYAMYVIMDRALPFIGDGLKPVQRRIIYSMSELGITHKAKYNKSARSVGHVMGHYHPHGDSSIYNAMVRMAQPFSLRYPLVDGQGNWGSPDDNDKAAAMRYTEARLAPIAELLLGELGQGTVKYQANFDGTLQEPEYLPARLPHILLNGTSGIAVAMATEIPSHNLNEVAAATTLLLDKPNASLDEILTLLPAPDLPTGAEIISPQAELRKIYATGKGSYKMRATWQTEKTKEGTVIVIEELPYQVSASTIMEQIAKQIQDKKLPLVDDIRDESDHKKQTRLVIIPRSNRVDLNALMDHLFATTHLEKSYSVNLNMLGLDGKPAVKNLLQILNEWLDFRRNTVKNRLNYRLEKILNRLHIIQGLLIAYLSIDEVIEIVRNEDKPKEVLMARFALSNEQADAILNLRLRQLAKLEEVELNAEKDALEKERAELENLINSDKLLNKLIKKEIQADAKQYGDVRRSPLIEREKAKALDQTEITPVEEVTVIVSEKGWIRCAKGHDIDPTTLSFRAGDSLLAYARGKSNQPVVLIDDTGRAYTLDVASLPSARGQGEALNSKLSLPLGANIVQLLMANEDQQVLLASDAGYGFICQFSDLVSRNKAGKTAITLPENAKVLPPQLIENQEVLLVAMSSVGRMLVFPVKELPQLSKGKGNKIINISATAAKARTELLSRLLLIRPEQSLEFLSGKRKIKLSPADIDKYRGERARKGSQMVRGLNSDTQINIID